MSLQGMVFSIHGLSALKKKEVTTILRDYGAELAYVGKNITHIITTAEEAKDPNNFKLISAKEKNVQVVTEEWLSEIVKKSKPKSKQQPIVIKKEATDISVNLAVNVFPKQEPEQKAVVPRIEDEVKLSVIRKPVNSTGSTAPSISLVLPESGPCTGTYQVALFGLNFVPSQNFIVQFGPHYVCREFEYHCSSAIIATVSAKDMPPGEVAVLASNDGGKHFGPSGVFRFHDNLAASITPHTENIALLQGQLMNVRRSISQLQSGMINVQKLELELRTKVEKASIMPIEDLEHISFEAEEDKKVEHTPRETAAHKERKLLKIKQDHSDREIKLFISSPFKDMQDERDIIAKKIMPQIRKMCAERDISFSYVDLRWGVTTSQNEQAATLLMCLREIERCNLFLGCYGERYGWCLSQTSHRNPSTNDELLKRTIDVAAKEFPWIENYRDRSVTEIEMRMVLDHAYKGGDKYAWFFLRDPYYVENIPKDKQHLFKSEGEYESEKLSKLKGDLAESGYDNYDYNNPTIFGELLLKQLTEYIDTNFPKGSELSPLESERFRHNAFSKEFSRAYLPNEQNFNVLDKHVASTNVKPLVILGESGIGKSALLANWAKRHNQHHPEDIIITHYIGCSAASTLHTSILSRIMSELQTSLRDYSQSIPSDTQQLIESFVPWIEKMLKTNKRHRLVLIIDALDNLDDRDNALDLLWFPQTFPSSIRCFLSSSQGRVSKVVDKRGWETYTLKHLTEAERISFLRMKLNQSSKKLSEKQEFVISAASPAGNPRYLCTLVEDLSLFGEFEELDTKISRDLKANNASELYEIVFQRLEADHETEKGVFSKFITYLWASRRGLYLETELALLMEEKKIEHHEYTAIYVTLEELLFSSSGLLNFSNRDIRKAVENRYLSTAEKRKEVHSTLASFFQTVEGFTERRVEELPWQLEQAEDWERLKVCISDLRMFDKLYKPSHKYDLFRYWRTIERNTRFTATASYTQSLGYTDQFPSGELVADLFYRVGYFMEETAKYEGAETVYVKARYYYQLASQSLDVAKMDYSLARVLIAQARYREAEEILKRSLDTYTKEKGENDLDVSHVLLRLGSLYTQLGKLPEAEKCFEKCLRVREEKLGLKSSRVGQTLKHMLTFYEEQGNLTKAVECGEQALKITEDVYGPEDGQVSGILLRLGHLYTSEKRYKLAKQTLKRALLISETKYGKDHPYTADIVYELGCLYLVKPEEIGNSQKSWTSDKAEKLFEDSLKIKEAALGPNHPDVSRVLNRLGSLYIERVELEEAETVFRRALKIREDKLGRDHSRVAQTLRHMITLFELQEKYPEAIQAAQGAWRIAKKTYGEESTQSLNVQLRLGQLYFLKDGYTSYEGKKLLQSVIAVKEKKLGKGHAQVVQDTKLLEELEKPPEVVEVVKVIPVIEKPKMEEETGYYAPQSSSWGGYMESIPQMDMMVDMPVPPPPPPPPVSMMPPPPPPPPGAKSAPAPSSYLADITSIESKGHKLKKAEMKNVKKNEGAKAGWWKQNYKYAKPKA